jgi:hypothetical protein
VDFRKLSTEEAHPKKRIKMKVGRHRFELDIIMGIRIDLDKENGRLKRLADNLTLEDAVLKEVDNVNFAETQGSDSGSVEVSQRLTCRALGQSTRRQNYGFSHRKEKGNSFLRLRSVYIIKNEGMVLRCN